MVRTREIALTALTALGLAACGGGSTCFASSRNPANSRGSTVLRERFTPHALRNERNRSS